jgi:hypothetical protein
MSIQTELNQIYQSLRTLAGSLDGVTARLEGIEQRLGGPASTEVVEALRAQNGLLNQIIQQQDRHTSTLKHILEEIIGPPASRVIFTIKVGNSITEGATKVKIKDNQEFDVAVTFQDAGGQPASVQGTPVWTSDNEAVLTVAPAADGLSAVVSAVGPVGTAQVSVSADADLGDGTTTITGVLDVEVIAGDATLIVLNPGPARDKAPTPAPPSA